MKNRFISFHTTMNCFVFGFGVNRYADENYEFDIVLGFIIIKFTWKRTI